MNHFQTIYNSKAKQYHRLISVEDVDGNLLPALERVTPLADKQILDLGTGTGRLPLLLGSRAKCLVGLDLYGDMLREQARQREQQGGDWELVQGDIRQLPYVSGWADVVTAGWAIGHLRSWFSETWQTTLGQVLSEMHRVVQPQGALIIIETLGTGSLQPAPPSEELAEYYSWLEHEWDFQRQTIRTDYQFESVEEAVTHAEFFFGAKLAQKIIAHDWQRLPEWTGVWGKTLRQS
ncbi:class I SAM-dependent methyltransferase [Anaerolineales bacterium HSG6]|nr:class I SAM-dependent methyltransferase [Anaerolineales bacterium HSG6]MDM8532611.1 class I SAM-dependent methyltransferase [Anaerolineales bacterium HSG25]